MQLPFAVRLKSFRLDVGENLSGCGENAARRGTILFFWNLMSVTAYTERACERESRRARLVFRFENQLRYAFLPISAVVMFRHTPTGHGHHTTPHSLSAWPITRHTQHAHTDA